MLPNELILGRIEKVQKGSKFMKKIWHYFAAVFGCAVIFAFDQFTKHLAVEHLSPQDGLPGRTIRIVGDAFILRFTTNDGAAFGMFSGQRLLLTVLPMLIMAGLVFAYIFMHRFVKQKRECACLRVSLVLVFGGALGNLVDRLRYPHAVVDFFSFELINFPIFNVADIFVVCAALLMCVVMVFFVRDEEKLKRSANVE